MKMGVSTALTQYAQTPEQYRMRLMKGSLFRNSGQYLMLKKIWKWPCAEDQMHGLVDCSSDA